MGKRIHFTCLLFLKKEANIDHVQMLHHAGAAF
jgi:hypothetical protein